MLTDYLLHVTLNDGIHTLFVSVKAEAHATKSIVDEILSLLIESQNTIEA